MGSSAHCFWTYLQIVGQFGRLDDLLASFWSKDLCFCCRVVVGQLLRPPLLLPLGLSSTAHGAFGPLEFLFFYILEAWLRRGGPLIHHSIPLYCLIGIGVPICHVKEFRHGPRRVDIEVFCEPSISHCLFKSSNHRVFRNIWDSITDFYKMLYKLS